MSNQLTLIIDVSSDNDNVIVTPPCPPPPHRIPPGTVIALNSHHVDANRFHRKNPPYNLYGVTVQWDEDRFGPERSRWVQVQAVANGEYTFEEDDSNNEKNIVFELVIKQKELEIIVNKGVINYIVEMDEYGLNPMRWFEADDDGFYTIKEEYEEEQCPRCMNPWCLFFTDKEDKKIPQIYAHIGNQYPVNQTIQNHYHAYRAIVFNKHGVLPRGVRRRLGICTETFVRNKFPRANVNRPFVGYQPA